MTMSEIWLELKDVEALGVPLRTIQRNCASRKYSVRQIPSRGRTGMRYQIELRSLPADIQVMHWEKSDNTYTLVCEAGTKDANAEADLYASLSDWERSYIDRFTALYNLTKGLRGRELKAFLELRQTKGMESWSYGNFCKVKARYEEGGIEAIIPKWGKRNGESKVPDHLFERFKTEYLKEGGPSLVSCWKQVCGFAKRTEPDFDFDSFPSHMAFLRRLYKEIPESAVYRARHGHAKWNRKYGYAINRSYDDLLAGEVWVSDHMQLDVACVLPDGKVNFLWVTAWIDVKTTKWLGWTLHSEKPNSDHIFLAFYRAAQRYGIPTDIIIDNGKDYRCKDFAGGRTQWWTKELDPNQVNSLVSVLMITPHYAWPYNAQSKVIERNFSKLKFAFDRHLVGYRGPDTVRKPEKLAVEIKSDRIWKVDELVSVFDTFIEKVHNRDVSENSKVLQGRCPDQLWEVEYHSAAEQGRVRSVTADGLRMCCMRASGEVTIARAVARDRRNGLIYRAPWMVAEQGTKCYMRRDPRDMSVAWFFEVGTDRDLGRAELDQAVSAIARSEAQQAVLGNCIEIKQQITKITEAYTKVKEATNDTYLEDRIAYVEAMNESRGYTPAPENPVGGSFVATKFDRVLANQRERDEKGSFPFDQFADLSSDKGKGKEIDLWGSESVDL